MPAEATWFGPADRPLSGWLHVPDGGRSRGGVVICPPLGMEYVNSHRAIRLVAEELAVRGFVTFRFDYDGTGDSAGSPDDPDRVSALFASIRHAVIEVRSVVGPVPVALVGLRMGATLATAWSAAANAAGLPLSALVVWDACRSGRAFLREQRSLGLLVGGRDLGAGAVDAPGFHFSAPTVEDLSRIDLTNLSDIRAPHVLVLTRTGQDPAAPLPTRADATRDTVTGMPEMLDVPPASSRVANEAVDRLVGWLDAVLPANRVEVEPTPRAEAVVADGVLERHVRVGTLGLAGVETRPSDGSAFRRTVLLLNTAAYSHIGPVRLWTDFARSWATQGVRSIRFDLSGVGDSPTRRGGVDDLLYAPYDEVDALDVVSSGAVGDAPILVGLCSGAHLALRLCPALASSSVVALNVRTTLFFEPRPQGPGFDLDRPRGWPRRMLRAVGARSVGRNLMRRLEVATTGSSSVWWQALVAARVVVSPGRGLAPLAGHDVTLICGTDDSVGYLTRGRRDLERAQARGLEFITVEDLYHVPMPVRQRQDLEVLVTKQVLRRVEAAVATGTA